MTEIPFKTSLSFEYLIAEIEKIAENITHPMNGLANHTLAEINKVPDLKVPVKDFSLVGENRELVNRMMAFVINPLEDDVILASTHSPFYPKPFYSTSLFDKVLSGDHKKLEVNKDLDKSSMIIAIIYRAYLIVLQQFYGFKFDVQMPFTYKLTDEKERTVKYYKMLTNHKFVDVKVHGKIKKLSQGELKQLFDNASNLDYWNEKIPLDKFEFTGFLHFTFIDITHDYVISQLKSVLLDKNAIISQEGFEQVKGGIRELVEIPDLEIGMAAFSDFDSTLNQSVIWKSLLPRSEFDCHEYLGTLYEQAYEKKKIVLTEDLKAEPKGKMVDLFLKKGIRNHAIVPLMLEDEIVGMMEFGASTPDQINMFQIKRLYELFPVFAVALKRSREELTDRIRSIIQEEFTTIHPTVEWRFQEAALEIHERISKGDNPSIEPIIFSDIVPIYGSSDIRGSSIKRNNAIQADLTEQLGSAYDILTEGNVQHEMPLLEDLSYKVRKHILTVQSGLKAGDEVSIIEFLKKEIDPVFILLKDRYDEMKTPVNAYFKKLDPEVGVLYKKRKDFENSLTRVNDVVSEIIDREQSKAQLVFPHYFEKYRTDGVEYNAYIGQSLVKGLKYSDIYLKNIRLWQLLVQVKVARKIRELQPSLKTKLDITQLILVHSNPLSITFRQDEKKFDVAGAYNIRYEITKKRIDKALIKGTNERLTQVGKIAIIYSYSEEIEEYKKYIDYMVSKNYLKSETEELELEDLTGASGLRALRVNINFDSQAEKEIINLKEISTVAESN
jgi:GAF domain-containing protein